MNRQIGVNNNVYFVASKLTTLDYSLGWILLFKFAEEYNRTKVTRHTNDVIQISRYFSTKGSTSQISPTENTGPSYIIQDYYKSDIKFCYFKVHFVSKIMMI